jgi:hypothetical protein
VQLTPLIQHIDGLIAETEDQKKKLNEIPFSKIASMLAEAITNYKNGLSIINDCLDNSLTKKAIAISQIPTKSGEYLSPDQIIYDFYRETVGSAYSTAEGFNGSIALLVESCIPWELYYWLLEIPQVLGVNKPFVFRQGVQFISKSFEDEIIKPLNPLIKIAKDPNIKGSLMQIPSVDLLAKHKICEGYVMDCIRSEAQNPIMWPILYHEMFEAVDKDLSSAGQGIMKNFETFVKSQTASMPTINDEKLANENWLLEILMDFLAITSFGPMYAKSLLDYCQRSPYYPTPEHPEMCYRIYSVYLYITSHATSQSDVLKRCQEIAKSWIEPEVNRYEDAGNLNSENKRALNELFRLMTKFRQTIPNPTFLQRLDNHIAQSQPLGTTLKVLLKKGTPAFENRPKFIPFKEPLLSFDHIRSAIFEGVSLAIHPDILLNVVIANADDYSKDEDYDIIVDSIKKWKIKEVWNSAVRSIKL